MLKFLMALGLISITLEIAEPKLQHIPNVPSPLSSCISQKWNLPINQATKISEAAASIANKDRFPSQLDVLSIVAIESGFDVSARSKSGARGLMQILYKKSQYDIHSNISDGVYLLNDYKDRLKSNEAAIHAYNLGIGNYLKGKRNKQYLAKFNKFKKYFTTIKESNNTCIV